MAAGEVASVTAVRDLLQAFDEKVKHGLPFQRSPAFRMRFKQPTDPCMNRQLRANTCVGWVQP